MNQENKSSEHGNTLLSWKFPEFQKYTFSLKWTIIASAIALGMAIYAVAIKDYLFLLIIFLLIIIYLLRIKREPRELEIKVTEDGLEIGNSFYEWGDIEKFWIIYDPPEIKNLHLAFKSSFRPSITIPLKNQNPLELRKILLNYLIEDIDKDEESFSESISKIIKL